MSADNGIYVLSTPTIIKGPKGDIEVKEYRVAYAQAIENIYYYKKGPLRDAELVRYFGESKVYHSRIDALVFAHNKARQIVEECGILEYGVSEIEWPDPFPQMIRDAAERLLKDEHNRVFEEVQPGMYKKRDGVDYLLYVSDTYK